MENKQTSCVRSKRVTRRKCKGWKERQKHVLERWKAATKGKVFQVENAVSVLAVETSQLMNILLEEILD